MQNYILSNVLTIETVFTCNKSVVNIKNLLELNEIHITSFTFKSLIHKFEIHFVYLNIKVTLTLN